MPPTTRTPALLLLLVLGACSPGPGPGGPDLRSGFTVVHSMTDPYHRWVVTPGGGRMEFAYFKVDDVSVGPHGLVISGAEVHVGVDTGYIPTADPNDPFPSRGSGSSGSSYGFQVLYISHDRGVTWTRREIADGATEPHEYPVRGDVGLGIHDEPAGMTAIVSTTGWTSGIPGSPDITHLAYAAPLDLDAGRFGDLAEFALQPDSWDVDGDRLVSAWMPRVNGCMPGAGTDLVRYDPATETASRVVYYGTNGAARTCQADRLTAIDGALYGTCALWTLTDPTRGTGVDNPLRFAEGCLVRIDLAAATTPWGEIDVTYPQELSGCTPAAELEGESFWTSCQGLRDHRLIRRGPGLYNAHERDGHVIVSGRWIDGGGRTPDLDLGPGTLLDLRRLDNHGPGGSVWGGLHRRYEGIVAIEQDGGAARFVQIADRGRAVEPTVLAIEDPCVPGSSCEGTYVVGAIQALGSELLVVYSLREEEQHIVVTRIPNPAYSVDPIDPPPGPVEGGPLERACARLWSCYPTRPEASLGLCLDYWVRGPGAAASAAYDAFVAVATGDCDGFRTSYPDLLRNEELCTAGCTGEIAVSCLEGSVLDVSDCRARGLSCRVAGDGGGVCGPDVSCAAGSRCEGALAVACVGAPVVSDCAALGLECHAGACTSPVRCASGDPALERRCDGDRVSIGLCSSEGFIVPAFEECARVGLTCRERSGTPGCGAACSGGEAQARCDGSRLTYCLGGGEHWIDCPGIGLGSCGSLEPPYGPVGCLP